MRTPWAIAAAAFALAVVPAAWAREEVSVSYRTPAALRGLDVVRRVDALGVAEVRTDDQAALRRRAGIRWVQPVASRERAAEPALVPWSVGAAAPEWQWTATHSDLV